MVVHLNKYEFPSPKGLVEIEEINIWKIYDNDDYEDNDDYDDEKLINYDLKWAKNGSQMLWFQMGTWI